MLSCAYMCILCVCVCVCVEGEGVADRSEPVRRGDRLAAFQLGGADVWRNHPAAGRPSVHVFFLVFFFSPHKRYLCFWCNKGSEKSLTSWIPVCAGRPGVSLHQQRGDGAAQSLSELQDPAWLCRPLRWRRRLQTHWLLKTGRMLLHRVLYHSV